VRNGWRIVFVGIVGNAVGCSYRSRQGSRPFDPHGVCSTVRRDLRAALGSGPTAKSATTGDVEMNAYPKGYERRIPPDEIVNLVRMRHSADVRMQSRDLFCAGAFIRR